MLLRNNSISVEADKQKKSSRQRTQRLVTYAMLIALAAVFSYMEALIPISLAVPGIKLGLANIVVLFALYRLGFSAALVISMLRIVLVSSMFGNMMMAIYSLAGAAVSLLLMAGLKKSGLFSIYGTSMAGGVAHNAAQICVAALAAGTPLVLSYLPVLILVGLLTGVLIGFLADLVLLRLDKLPGLKTR